MTTAGPVRYVLLPGRHHLLTRAQAGYLRSLLNGQVVDDQGRPVEPATHELVVAVRPALG